MSLFSLFSIFLVCSAIGITTAQPDLYLGAVGLLEYSTPWKNNSSIMHLGIASWQINPPAGTTVVTANVTWADLGSMKSKYPKATFGAQKKAWWIDSYRPFPVHQGSGLAFAVVQPLCYGGDVCNEWRNADAEWQFFSIRYKYGDIYVPPSVMTMVQLPTTNLLSSSASVRIVSPKDVFIFDVDNLVHYVISEDGGFAKVVSVKAMPKVKTADRNFQAPMVPFVCSNVFTYYSDQNTLVQYHLMKEEMSETPADFIPTGYTKFIPDLNGGEYYVANRTFDVHNNYTHAQIYQVIPPSAKMVSLVGYIDNCNRGRPTPLECTAQYADIVFSSYQFYTMDTYSMEPKFAIWSQFQGKQMEFKLQIPPSPPPPRFWNVGTFSLG